MVGIRGRQKGVRMNLDEAIEKIQVDMATLINESGLPLSVIDLILEKLLSEVRGVIIRNKRENAMQAKESPAEEISVEETNEE